MVPAGTVTISEQSNPAGSLSNVYTVPSDRLVSVNLAAQSAQVTVANGDISNETTVYFVNVPAPTATPTNTATNTATTAPTNTATSTPTTAPTNTATATSTPTTGVVEICKKDNPSGSLNGDVFTFMLNGQSYAVLDGFCTGPLTVPAGTVTISEQSNQPAR